MDPVRLEAYRRELEDVIDAVRHGTAPLVNGEEGVATQLMLDAVALSADTGAPVPISLEAQK